MCQRVVKVLEGCLQHVKIASLVIRVAQRALVHVVNVAVCAILLQNLLGDLFVAVIA